LDGRLLFPSQELAKTMQDQIDVVTLREHLFDGLVPQRTFAEALGVTLRAVQKMIKQNKVETRRVGSKTFIVVSSAGKAA
jgi:predicted RNA-binding protein associated with RNAse of E/G family